jgi:hypothetical protein
MFGIGLTALVTVLAFVPNGAAPLHYLALVVGVGAVVAQVQSMRATSRMQADLTATKHGLIKMQEALAEAQERIAKMRHIAPGAD